MSDTKLEHIRHTLAHLLAAAVLDLYPDAKPTIGPAIEDGFYYDFDFSAYGGNAEQRGKQRGTTRKGGIKEDDLPRIEQKMREILPNWHGFKEIEVNPNEAEEIFSGNDYKLELIDELKRNKEKITVYYSGPNPSDFDKRQLLSVNGQMSDVRCFIDLCRGGHAEKPAKEIKPDAFKLSRIAGAYWRGDEKNPMLTRIYGLAFGTKKELQEHVAMLEEAKKRDHRKIGKEMDLFSFSEMVGSGLPLWSPKGTVLRNELQNHLLEVSKKYGMQPVTIPHIAKRKLYETSGHTEKFGNELLQVISHYDEFVMKPVNCPHHTQIYASRPRSYRDLPLRYMESTMQYRDEKPGEIGGLTRVRSITVDDGHIFCTPDQIEDEAKNIAKIIEEFYAALGMFGNHWVSLSVRDPKTPDAYIGEPKDWDKAEQMLAGISDELGLKARRVEGEAAIYGPKLDYIFKDSLGREWQLATIQIDFAMPKRFGLTYVNEKGEKAMPVMIHRAILGSYERFLAILIEHYAGAFPLWLSPVQVAVLPISDKYAKYANRVAHLMKEAGIRVELDDSNESIGKRIRETEIQKTPYILVVGEKEEKAGTAAVRVRGKGDIGAKKLDDIFKELKSALQLRSG